MIAVEFDRVTKQIGKNKVIKDVSFTIPAGIVCGLEGVNGSGKTMIMRLIAGLIYPTSGTVTVFGKILGKEISFPESLGALIENPAFLNSYTAFQNLKTLASIRKAISDDEIIFTLNRVGLDINDISKKKYKKFSLGMKQRLGIAAAIMEKPEIILLDEPTNSLDEMSVARVIDIIKEEKNRGATIIISCHNSRILDKISDLIFTVEAGMIVQQRGGIK